MFGFGLGFDLLGYACDLRNRPKYLIERRYPCYARVKSKVINLLISANLDGRAVRSTGKLLLDKTDVKGYTLVQVGTDLADAERQSTPLLAEDLMVLSRPVTYLTWQVSATDGKEHNVALYYDNRAELAVNNPATERVKEHWPHGSSVGSSARAPSRRAR